jgi:hypothetical protein
MFSQAIVNRQQSAFHSWVVDSENPQKEDNPPQKPKKSRAKKLGCCFVTSAGLLFGGGSFLTLQVLGFTTLTDVTLTTTITGEFQSNDEPVEKLCDYSAVACCDYMEDILGDEELTSCITDSCDVTDVSDRRLSLFDGFRSLEMVRKQINLVQSFTFKTLDVSEKKTTVEDLTVAVQTEDTTW